MASASSVASVSEVVLINPGSDGDSSRWPAAGMRREVGFEAPYMTKLGTKWMTDRGEAIKGNGYALFGKARNNDPTHVDRYLCGHPSYKFRSTEEFYDHFKHLMDNGTALGCKCIACRGGRKTGASQGSATPRTNGSVRTAASPTTTAHQAPPTVAPPAFSLQETPLRQVHRWLDTDRPPTPEHEMVDDEGTPDIYRRLADRLRHRMVMDDPIKQHRSFDWVINRRSVGPVLSNITTQPAFVPRQGELVLFVRGLKDHHFVSFDKSQQRFAMWDSELKTLVELPQWEAGVVTDTPQEAIHPEDLLVESHKTYQVNYSGFRVEPMAMVGSPEKHWSKRIAHVRMHAMRPLVLYREVLKATKPKDYHATVQHALIVMSSISLFNPFHFKGLWPQATVFCRGIFIGSELLVVGDTVRLMPGSHQDDTQVWDAMKITSIKMKMIHLDARDNPEYDDPTAESTTDDKEFDCCLHIDGIAFTRDENRAWRRGQPPINKDTDMLPGVLHDYGRWYHLHDPSRRWKIPFTRVLGRCYEQRAMKSWFSTLNTAPNYPTVQGFAAINTSQDENHLQNVDLMTDGQEINKGLRGIMSARTFSTQRDPRIQRLDGKSWFWADYRIEQLDLHEVKGQVVAPVFHGRPTRDPQAWSRAMNIRERGAGHRPKTAQSDNVTRGIGRGRPSMKSSTIQSSALGSTFDQEPETDVDLPSNGVVDNFHEDVEMPDMPDMQDMQDTVVLEEAYIDPTQITVVSEGDSSEVESEDEDD